MPSPNRQSVRLWFHFYSPDDWVAYPALKRAFVPDDAPGHPPAGHTKQPARAFQPASAQHYLPVRACPNRIEGLGVLKLTEVTKLTVTNEEFI